MLLSNDYFNYFNTINDTFSETEGKGSVPPPNKKTSKYILGRQYSRFDITYLHDCPTYIKHNLHKISLDIQVDYIHPCT